MSLTGSQLDRIHQSIRAAYTRDKLRAAVRICMEEDFDDLVPDKGFDTQVFELVQWADRLGRVMELVRCVYEHNQENEGLRTLWEEVQGWETTWIGSARLQAPVTGHHVFLAYSHLDASIMRRLRCSGPENGQRHLRV